MNPCDTALSPCYLTINQSENFALTLLPAPPRLAFKNAFLKPMVGGGVRVF